MVSDTSVKDSIIGKLLYLQNSEVLVFLLSKNYPKHINVFFDVIQQFILVNLVFLFIILFLCVLDNFLNI